MEEKDLMLQKEMCQYVKSIGKWNKFFGILAYLGAATLLLCFLFFLLICFLSLLSSNFADAFVEGFSESYGAVSSGMAFGILVLYMIYFLVFGILYIPVGRYLMGAGREATQAVTMHDNEAAVRFMHKSKKFWKYYGIMTITMVGFAIVMMFIAFIIGIVSAL